MCAGKRRQFFTSSTSIPKCIAVICIFLTAILSCVFGSPEFDLKEKLLSGYDKQTRPVKNHTKHVTIILDMALQQISALDERNQILTTSIWMRWKWEDEYLVWDPSNNSNITLLQISPSVAWTPDIAIYNNVKAEEAYWPGTYDLSVTSNGSVSWNFPFIVETSCRIDISRFPYDTQLCYFKFGSWGYNGYQIDVQNKSASGDTTAFVDNGIWALQQLSAARSIKYYSCCSEPYPDITFTATLKRRSLFYTVNLILPCILFSFINLCTFLLPVESGDKISLNVTLLLALDVFLLLVAETMPPQSEVVPDIGIYFIACNGIISLSTICSVFIIHLYYRGSRGQNASIWVRRYIIFSMGRLLGYSETLGTKPICTCRSTKFEKCQRGLYGNPIRNINRLADTQNIPMRTTSLSSTENVTGPSSVSYVSGESRHATLSSLASDTTLEVDGKYDIMDPVLEWQNVSLVMDRFFFVIFTLATIALTLYSLSRIE